MWRRCLILTFVAMATSIGAARADVIIQDTISNKKVIYDPIDYAQVSQHLQLASRPTLWQRVTKRLRTPLFNNHQVSNFNTTGWAGVRYSAETNFMITGVVAGEYSTAINDADTPLSRLSLTMDVSLTGYYRFFLAGDTYMPRGRDRLIYSAATSSMPVKFWGLGYSSGLNNHYTKYVNKSTSAQVRYLREAFHGLWVGADVEYNYADGVNFDAVGYDYLKATGVSARSVSSAGIGLVAVYDTRKAKINTTDGLYLSLLAQTRPKFISNIDSNLLHIEAVANYYVSVWQGGVIATDLYANLWSSATPWIMWPSVGGSNRMRGYYYGRYTDRKMLSGQVEVRQQIYGPIGCSVWGGAAKVFPSFKTFKLNDILPNYGLGLRVALGDGTSLRIDYGFGRRSNELIININEAF